MGYEAGSSTNTHALAIHHQSHMDRTSRTTGPQGGRGRITSTAQVPQGEALSFLPVQSHVQPSMHDALCPSSSGTTSTSVPKCRKETPDRLAVRTVERTVTHKLPRGGGGGGGGGHSNPGSYIPLSPRITPFEGTLFFASLDA